MIEDRDLPEWLRREAAAHRLRERRDRLLLVLGHAAMFCIVGTAGAAIWFSLAGAAA